MFKGNGRKDNAQHLSDGHDNGKDNRTELLDRKEDANLTTGRGNGRQEIVPGGIGVGQEEFPHDGNITADNQTDRRHTDGRDIDPQHHLVRIDVILSVLFVDLVLVLGGKTVKGNVEDQEDQSDKFRVAVPIFGTFLTGQGENGDTNGNQKGLEILEPGVGFSLQGLSHHHDGNNLAAFKDRLFGEGDKFEGRILRPARHGIGQGGRAKGEQRSRVVGKDGTVSDFDHNHGDHDGKQTIGKDTKGSTGELSIGDTSSRIKMTRHDEFLHVTPGQVGYHQADEAKAKGFGRLPKFPLRGSRFRFDAGRKDIAIGDFQEGFKVTEDNRVSERVSDWSVSLLRRQPYTVRLQHDLPIFLFIVFHLFHLQRNSSE